MTMKIRGDKPSDEEMAREHYYPFDGNADEGNVIGVPSGVSLYSDVVVPDTFVKVRFECHDDAKDQGYESERMWLYIVEGNHLYGVGRLDNYPLYCDAEYGAYYKYEPHKKTGMPHMVERVK